MKNKIIYIIFFLQAFIFNLSNVITPRFLTDLELPKFAFGYYSAIWSLGMLISSPIWGKMATRYGRKNLIIIGTIIYGLSQFGFYFINNVVLLGLLRFTSGIGVGAIITLLLSYLILNTKPSDRASTLSSRMAFITIGMTISYTVSGYIGIVLTRELFLYQSILSIIFVILIILVIKEKKIDKSCVYPKQYHLFDSIRYIAKIDKTMLMFLFSITLTTMTFVNLDKFLDLYIVDLGHPVSVVGNIKMVFGIVLVVTNFSFVPKLKKYLGNVFVLQTISILMSIVIMITFMNSNIIIMLNSVFLLFIVLKGVYTTGEQLFFSKVVDKSDLNLFIGIRQSFTCLGMILGPIIGGHIYAYNHLNLFHFNVVCLLISSVLISYIKLAPNKSKEIAFSS